MNTTASFAEHASVKVPFSLSCPGARAVSVAIFFNDWTRECRVAEQGDDANREEKSHMMVRELVPLKQTTPGLWRCELTLSPGWYEYLFLVDGTWVMDPDAPEVRPDGAGGFNAARRVESVPVVEATPIPVVEAPVAPSARRIGLRRAG